MNSPLYEMAAQNTMVVINPATLLEYLRQDRDETYNHGFSDGVMSIRMLSKKEAAKFLDVSEGTIDNLRKRGEIESAEYCGQVHFSLSQLKQYVEKHTGLYYTIKSKMNK